MSSTLLQTFEQSKTLRNAFLLLALTLVPTALGVFLGMTAGFVTWMASHALFFIIGWLVFGIALIIGIHGTSESNPGISLSLLGIFTFITGLLISTSILHYLALANGPTIVLGALVGTIGILIAASIYAVTTKRDFTVFGGILFSVLVGLIIVGLLNLWLQLAVLQLALSYIGVVLFSAYIIYDVQMAVQNRYNYIEAALGLYLDIVNLFLNLLHIVASFND